jgi:hypothetical protein
VDDGRRAPRRGRPLPQWSQGPPPAPVPSRSWAAVPAALALLVVGLLLGHVTALIPLLLGLGLLYVTVNFLSSRVNPLSIGFYLSVKPAWSAIGVVALVGLLLIAVGWTDLARGLWPLLP